MFFDLLFISFVFLKKERKKGITQRNNILECTRNHITKKQTERKKKQTAIQETLHLRNITKRKRNKTCKKKHPPFGFPSDDTLTFKLQKFVQKFIIIIQVLKIFLIQLVLNIQEIKN